MTGNECTANILHFCICAFVFIPGFLASALSLCWFLHDSNR